MSLIYRCDRCQTTADPGPSSRQDGMDGPPPLPLRWATRQVAGDTQPEGDAPRPRTGRSLLLCGSCDDSLVRWVEQGAQPQETT